MTGLQSTVLAAATVACAWAVGLLAAGCQGTVPEPVAVSAYAADRALCVEAYTVADDARACMRRVDIAYGQDGGLR